MEKEDFTIRVTRKGELVVDLRGLPARRVQELLEHLEETLGPARTMVEDSGSASGGEELVLEEETPGTIEDEEETREHPRLRILRD